MFDSLSDKLNDVFSRLKGKGKLSEDDVKEALREVRLALLEADVNYKVVKDFVAAVEEKAVGEEVMKSLTPGQQVIKIVRDELAEILGHEREDLHLEETPAVVLLVGLQVYLFGLVVYLSGFSPNEFLFDTVLFAGFGLAIAVPLVPVLVVGLVMAPVPGPLLASLAVGAAALGGVGLLLYRRAVPKWTRAHLGGEL